MPKENETKMNKKTVDHLNNVIPMTKMRKRHAGPWRKGLPDITGGSHGFLVELEGKLPGNNNITTKQKQWLQRFKAIGAITGVYHNPREAEVIVLKGLKQRGVPVENFASIPTDIIA
jgi:hypothetical protein